jgi:hypothetical protein
MGPAGSGREGQGGLIRGRSERPPTSGFCGALTSSLALGIVPMCFDSEVSPEARRPAGRTWVVQRRPEIQRGSITFGSFHVVAFSYAKHIPIIGRCQVKILHCTKNIAKNVSRSFLMRKSAAVETRRRPAAAETRPDPAWRHQGSRGRWPLARSSGEEARQSLGRAGHARRWSWPPALPAGGRAQVVPPGSSGLRGCDLERSETGRPTTSLSRAGARPWRENGGWRAGGVARGRGFGV